MKNLFFNTFILLSLSVLGQSTTISSPLKKGTRTVDIYNAPQEKVRTPSFRVQTEIVETKQPEIMKRYVYLKRIVTSVSKEEFRNTKNLEITRVFCLN